MSVDRINGNGTNNGADLIVSENGTTELVPHGGNGAIAVSSPGDKINDAVESIDVESGIALGVKLPVKVMGWLTKGTEKAMDNLDRQISFGEKLLDVKSAQAMVKHTFTRLDTVVEDIRTAKLNGANPILLVGLKREVRICKKQITELFREIDPDLTDEDIAEMFEEIDAVVQAEGASKVPTHYREGSRFVDATKS